MAAEQFVNDLGVGTTLYTALTDTTGTSVVVVNYAGIPAVPQFRIRIDTEIMLVTAISIGGSNSTLTVTRGAEGSTAATHSAGAGVYHVLTAASIQAPGLQYAAFPASTTGYLVPIISGNFSTSGTVGTSTANQLANSVTLTDAATASTHLRRYKATAYTPGTAATAIAYFQNNCVMENYHYSGLYVSDGTKLITYAIEISSSIKVAVDKWATETTAEGSKSPYLTAISLTSSECWHKLVDGGTGNSLTYSISRDGLNWVQIHTVSRTDYLTPSELGIVWQSNNATHGALISWLSWSLT